MQTRHIIFDLDGTLVDSLPGIQFSVDCALAECNFEPRRQELRPLIGPPIRTILSQLIGETDEARLSVLEHAFRRSYDAEGWSKTVPADSMRETLITFSNAGLQLFVVTNKPQIPARRILAHLGIDSLLHAVLSRDSRIPAFSSKAEMLQCLVHMHQLEPGECLYVGDTSEDYWAGKAAGLRVAIAGYGYGEPNLCYPECIHLNNLGELLTIIEAMEMS